MPRTIYAGGSLGVPTVDYPEDGTIGLALSDAGDSYAMSCAHVVAAPANGNAFGVPVAAPYQVEQKAAPQIVGKVRKWIPIRGDDNVVDAAVVLLDSTKVTVSNAGLALSAIQSAIGLQVVDYTRFASRQLTIHAARQSISAIAGQTYDVVPFTLRARTYTFFNLLAYEAEESLKEGDSGAAVVDTASGQFLGLHMGGPGGRLGYCTIAPMIWKAFSAYQFTFLP